MQPGEIVIVNVSSAGQGLARGTRLTIVERLTRDDGAWGFGDYELRTATGRPVWLYRREIAVIDVKAAA